MWEIALLRMREFTLGQSERDEPAWFVPFERDKIPVIANQ